MNGQNENQNNPVVPKFAGEPANVNAPISSAVPLVGEPVGVPGIPNVPEVQPLAGAGAPMPQIPPASRVEPVFQSPGIATGFSRAPSEPIQPSQKEPVPPPPFTPPVFTPREPRVEAPVGVGAQAVPPTPLKTAEINLRTMQTDAESLKQTGGLEATPKTFSPADLGNEPVFKPEQAAMPKPAIETKASKRTERRLVLGLVAVAVFGLAALIYFFILPRIMPKTPAPAAQTPPVAPVPTEPQPPAPAPVKIPHLSYFSLAADAIESPVLKEVNLANIQTVLNEVSVEKLETGKIKELAFFDSNNSVVPFETLLKALFTDLSSGPEATIFESDSTWFLYFDQKGIWPGFIAKAKKGVDKASIDLFNSKLEASGSLSNIFLKPAGAIKKFDKGSVRNTPVRFVRFANEGFVFEYVWLEKGEDKYLAASASFPGMGEAMRRLGF
jgi:hypothetical protein